MGPINIDDLLEVGEVVIRVTRICTILARGVQYCLVNGDVFNSHYRDAEEPRPAKPKPERGDLIS